MKRKTTVGLGCLLFAACGNGLPPNAPEFRVEVSANTRADSFSCFAGDGVGGDDDFLATSNINGAVPEAPQLQSDANLCMRFTVLNPDGTPVLGDDNSSCAIRPQKALGIESDQVALVLDTAGALAEQKDDEFLMRVDLFNGEDLVQTGLVSNFLLDEENGPKRRLSFFQEEQLSCVVPDDIFRGTKDTSLFNDKNSILETPRGFHSATTIGDLAASDGEGVLVAGGVTGLFEAALQNGEAPRIHDSIEVFDRSVMRFVPNKDEAGVDQVKLATPRAFHESFAFPSREGELQVMLVGGTTESNGLAIEFKLFGNELIQPPLPILPLVVFSGDVGSYGANEEKGAELVTLNAKTLKPIRSEAIDMPGRFGAAVVGIGERIFSFGGIATSTVGQTCQDLLIGGGNTLTNFLCGDGIVLERGATNDANNFNATLTGPMSTTRVGASAVKVNDTTILIVGGNVGDLTKGAELAKIDAAGAVSYSNVSVIGDVDSLRRSFFALAAVPGTANQFVMFGGDKLSAAPVAGRLIEGAGDNNSFGVPNFAALLTLDVATDQLTVAPLLGPSLDQDLTRPLLDQFLPIPATNGLTLADLDGASEDLDPLVLGADSLCGSAVQDCPASNQKERVAYPIVVPGPDNSLLFAGGARGPMFPQDAILKFSINGGLPIMEELKNPGNNESLHLFRRALGGRGAFLPGHGASSLLMFTGGITGAVAPGAPPVFFFENPLFLGARRDASFFAFGAPDFGIKKDECDEESEEGFSESDACGFANSSLKPQRLFFIPIRK
jgi:hypothetical protein